MRRMISPQAIVQDLSERAMNDVNAVLDFYRKLARMAQWLYRRANSFFHSRFFFRYGWAILPFIVVAIFQIGTHYNYPALWLGVDQPNNSNNIVVIMQTGEMPPPLPAGQSCSGNATCQAYQPPLFYKLMAIPAQIEKSLFNLSPDDAIAWSSRLILTLFSLVWFLLIVIAIQWILPRRVWIVKALIACACIAIPQVILTETMLANTFIESITSLGALLVLYLILRTPHKFQIKWWIFAAALVGLGMAIKYSGVLMIFVYAIVAVLIALGYAIKRHIRQMGQVMLGALIGVPLIIIPYATTVQHIQLYFSDVVGRDIPGEVAWDGNLATYFGTFNTDVFNYPVWGLTPNQTPDQQTPGLSSFWSVQYVNLFSDVWDSWMKAGELTQPSDQLKINLVDGSTMFLGHALSIARFNSLLLVVRLALPIALLMVIGLIGTLLRFVLHPRWVLHDGTGVILIVALVNLIMSALLSVQYHQRAAFDQPGEAIFIYVLLLIMGTNWLMRLWRKRRALRIPMVLGQTVIMTATAAFTVASFALFWLNAG